MPHRKLGVVLGVLTAVIALACPPRSRADADAIAADEKLLKQIGVEPDGPGLLEFFRKRTPTDEDRQKYDVWVRQLGSRSYKERQKAMRDLLSVGRPVVQLLRAALKDEDIEIARRADLCLNSIEKGPGPELPAAAARLLAVKQPKGATLALLKYLPYADDEWLEDEVFTCLGQVALRDGKVDPAITAALKDKLPARRGAAAYLLGRMGDVSQREAVRQLLADSDAAVRLRASHGLADRDITRSAQEAAETDEKLLKDQKVPVDGIGLLKFFRDRTLSEADQRRYQDMVRQLGDSSYRKRAKATRQLLDLGSSALPFLRPALTDKDEEIYRRAAECVRKIESGPATAVPGAAVRVLLRRAPPEALETLLAYVPFADDDTVEDEVLGAMCVLATREVKVNPALVTALRDPLPVRRGAAAYVLGYVGTAVDCEGVRRLCNDPSVKVRLRAAQGLIAAKDKAGVPELVKVLGEAPNPAFLTQAEETLSRIAVDKGPQIQTDDKDAFAAKRDKTRQAWTNWWDKEGTKVSLGSIRRQEGFQNLRVICEFDWNGRVNGGKVWECDRTGKERWKIENLLGPMDAEVLPNRHVLIAENNGRKVTERDQRGNILWEYMTNNGNPVGAFRLANGDTFIACYYNFMVVRKDKSVVYSEPRGPNSYIFSASRMHNGHVVLMTSSGAIEEIDPRNGKVLHTVSVMNQGNWCGAEGLRNGRYLVALMNFSKIAEYDKNGKEYSPIQLIGVHTATRLPNGHTLAACMNNRVVKEYDRNGKEVWSHTTNGRPWRIHYR
jgi:HEAT repeat protein